MQIKTHKSAPSRIILKYLHLQNEFPTWSFVQVFILKIPSFQRLMRCATRDECENVAWALQEDLQAC